MGSIMFLSMLLLSKSLSELIPKILSIEAKFKKLCESFKEYENKLNKLEFPPIHIVSIPNEESFCTISLIAKLLSESL